jgi:lipoate-protein ligase A
MALDVALLARARRTGDAVDRVYSWSAPTLSVGRHERTDGVLDRAAIAAAGLDVVRRPTGGRALLHHREITYSVTAPVEDTLASSYARLTSLLMNALGRLGVPVTVAGATTRHASRVTGPCFAEPSTGELVAAGRKLAGSAQWRHEGALLQHGSILVHDDQDMLGALCLGERVILSPPATLASLLGREPSTSEFADALLAAIRARSDASAERLELEAAVSADASRLADDYRDPAWTWRR